jgi:hypothetical protein
MRRLVTVVIAYAAVQRALRSELAVFALVVDAKDDLAEGFYRHHGFISLGNRPLKLVFALTGLSRKSSGI